MLPKILPPNFHHGSISMVSWGQKSDLKICPEAEKIRPKMTIRPLDEQALSVSNTSLGANNVMACSYPDVLRKNNVRILFRQQQLYSQK